MKPIEGSRYLKDTVKTIKKCLQKKNKCCIISNVVTLIALKREVAAKPGRFSVERRSSYETGDKSLYHIIFCHRADKTCE